MWKCFLIICCFFASMSLCAQSFDAPFFAARQNAMGGTGVSTLPDLASTYVNPGALSFLYSNGVMLGVNAESYDNQALGLSANSINNVDSPGKLNLQLFGSWSKNQDSPLCFGLGIYDDYGAKSAFELKNPAYSWRHDYSFVSKTIQPTVSYRLTDRLGVGLGVKLIMASLDWKMGNSNNADAWEQERLTANGAGLGLNFGMYWSPNDVVQLGFNYRSSSNLDSYDVDLEAFGENVAGDLNVNLSTPASWSLGMNLMVNSNLAVAIETEFVGWSGINHLPYQESGESLANYAISRVEARRKNQWQYKMGLEYAIFGQFQLRAGLAYRTASVYKGHLMPNAISNSALVLSWGAGYYYQERLMIDFALQLVTGSDRSQVNADLQAAGTFVPNLPAQLYAEGLYGTKAFIPALTVAYRL